MRHHLPEQQQPDRAEQRRDVLGESRASCRIGLALTTGEIAGDAVEAGGRRRRDPVSQGVIGARQNARRDARYQPEKTGGNRQAKDARVPRRVVARAVMCRQETGDGGNRQAGPQSRLPLTRP